MPRNLDSKQDLFRLCIILLVQRNNNFMRIIEIKLYKDNAFHCRNWYIILWMQIKGFSHS